MEGGLEILIEVAGYFQGRVCSIYYKSKQSWEMNQVADDNILTQLWLRLVFKSWNTACHVFLWDNLQRTFFPLLSERWI